MTKICISLLQLPLSVALRCGNIMVSSIRRNFCQYRIWNKEALEGVTKILISLLFLPLSVGLRCVGPLWSQGLEGTSVSIGREIMKLWKEWRKYAVGSPGSSDIETGIEWNRVRPEAKALLGKVGNQWQLFFMSLSLSLTHSLTHSLSLTLSHSSTPICWDPIWEHYGRKA